MKYRRLGKTGLKVSVIGLGTHQFGGAWGKNFSQRQVDQILGTAYDVGINLIDTAAGYGPHLSERLIGNSISGQRQYWTLATKFGQEYAQGQEGSRAFSVKDVTGQLDRSLNSLRTDYIDIYQFHSGTNQEFDNDRLWTYLDKQVQAGKIRYLGISLMGGLSNSGDLYQLENAERVKAQVIQVIYNRLNKKAEEKIFPICQNANLGALARIPLAKGFLTGKYKPGATFPIDDHRSDYEPGFNNQLLEQAETIKTTEVPAGVEMSQWAIAWCLKSPAVTSIIAGCQNVDQLLSNAGATSTDLIDKNHPLDWDQP